MISLTRFIFLTQIPESVLVIGAGVMGLTTALHLAERGYKVTVLEKADNVAMVRNLFFKGLFENDVTPMLPSWVTIVGGCSC